MIAELFTHPALRNGQLIQHMCLNLSVSQLESFVSPAECPGLADVLFNSSNIMSDCMGSKINVRSHKDFSIDYFPYDKKGEHLTYGYSLKFALLFRPNDNDLHELILSRMDFDKFKPLQLEILCLIAHFKGCKHPRFVELFDQQIWLRGQEVPEMSQMRFL